MYHDSRETLFIRRSANGYIVSTGGPASGFEGTEWVFTTAETLGKWVAEYYSIKEKNLNSDKVSPDGA